MDSRLVVSVSGDGRLRTYLAGRGKGRERLLRGFARYVEPELPDIRGKIRKVLGEEHEDSNSDLT